MPKPKLSKDEVENIVNKCYSIADFCRMVGWVTKGNSYRCFHNYVKKYNLDTSHFVTKKNEGNFNIKGKKYSLDEYLKTNSIRGKILIEKLVDAGVKERKCESCNNYIWKGVDIPLEVHHIDGNHYNNDITNLQLLCPNCHSLTDNFRGKRNKIKKDYFCKKCGEKITKYSFSGLCNSCSKKNLRKAKRPSKEELTKLLIEGNFTSVSKIFNVSDNTIRKWCKTYGMSPHSKDYIK